MSYNYYQQNVPGWGTNQLQFGQPPAPNFQPQPNWGGMDFYNAHAVNPDSSLYDNAWNNVRSYSGSTLEQGVGMHEAKHWHRRAYGGLGELGQMQPAEIGHAAAYEAYRTWIHNSSMYEPLSDDVERQREALTGLAVAEASRLLQFSNRSMDHYARTAASEAAAATASIIFHHVRLFLLPSCSVPNFYQSRERDEGEYHRSRSRSRARHGSFSSSYDDDDPTRQTCVPHLVSRDIAHTLVTDRIRRTQMAGSMSSNVAPIAMPPSMPSGYAAPGGYGASYGAPMQLHGQSSSSYGSSTGMPMAVSQSYTGVPMMGHRQRSTSMSIPYTQAQYPRVQYVQGQQYMMPHSVPQPTTIIVGSGHRKHRKKSKRSRSIDHARYSSSSRY
ncbi:hypothetical protein B0H13DRAFT_2248412 [Mycena leptocephala]|nr:hypothetical protein B0H13DRAFT_2248412 [Mycena leptocephala]